MTDRRRYLYRVVELRHEVDGDTADLRLVELEPPPDFGFYVDRGVPSIVVRIRLVGQGGAYVDAWETRQAGGPAACGFAEAWIRSAISGGVLCCESFRRDTVTPDASFGRWTGDLWRSDTGEHLADALRAAGFVKS